jgi:hypothetical protein
MLFNILLLFAALFAIAFVQMNPKLKRKNNTEAKAEFIITVTWPTEIDDDVDVYVEDPMGNLVFFSARENGLMHLDRDDLGSKNDTIKTAEGFVEFKENVERVSIRGIIKGEYVVNVHMYAKRVKPPAVVTIQIDKVNPFSTIALRDVVLEVNGDEKTVIRFTIDEKGNVTSTNRLHKKLAEERHDEYYNGPGYNPEYDNPEYDPDNPEYDPEYDEYNPEK